MSRRRNKQQQEVEQVVEFNPIKALNEEQREYIRTINQNDIVIATGKSGSGKTCVACGVAAGYLYNKLVDRIVLTRPAVASESIGFLPGDASEKIDPFLKPLFMELSQFINIQYYLKSNKIEILPIAFMRGVTLKNSFVLVDEIENLTYHQFKLLLTRFGQNSKFVLMGDISQTDLISKVATGTRRAIHNLIKVATPENKIAIVELTKNVRHPIVDVVLNALEGDGE